jgi:hypothetical protein
VGDLVGLDEAEVAELGEEGPEGAGLNGAVPGFGVSVEELGEGLAGVVAEGQREEFDAHALVDGGAESGPDFFGPGLADLGGADRADPDQAADGQASEVGDLAGGLDLDFCTPGGPTAAGQPGDGGQLPELGPLPEPGVPADDPDLTATPSDLRGERCP